MGPPWGAFCQITLTTCYWIQHYISVYSQLCSIECSKNSCRGRIQQESDIILLFAHLQTMSHDAKQVQRMPSCGVHLCVCLSVCHVREFCQNEWTYLSLDLASLLAFNTATSLMLSSHVLQRHQVTVPQVMTLNTGSKRWSLLMARDDDEMFMTRSLSIMPKTTEQHLIVHSDKSVAYVTNNKRLCSTFCTIKANYW